MKGRECIVLHVMRTPKVWTVVIEFTDNGQQEVVGMRALRKVNK